MAAIPIWCGLAETAGAGVSIAFNTTQYLQLGTRGEDATENNRALLVRWAGTVSKFQVVISANTIATSATTIRTRLANANGGQSVSVGAGATGSFQDTTNSDTFSGAGQKFNFQVVTPNTSGAIAVSAVGLLSTATTNTIVPLVGRNGSTNAASATAFASLAGGRQGTEATSQISFRQSGTLQNLYLFIVSNGRTSTTTWRSRINGANGNQVVSVLSTGTGAYEDLSNTDAVVSGDEAAATFVTGSAGGTITFGVGSAFEFVTTDGSGVTVGGTTFGTQAANTTRYLAMGGNHDPFTTEAAVALLALGTVTVHDLQLNISANTVSATSTVTFRKNTADGNQTLSIGSNASGVFEDTSNTDSLTATDSVALKVVTGATGTTLTYGAMMARLTTGGAGSFNETLTGATTPTGALLKSTAKTLAGGSTPTGALIKQVQQLLTGGTTPAGALLRTVQAILAGATTPAGTLARAIAAVITGTTDPAGAVTGSSTKSMSGATTPAGAVLVQTQKALDGSTTPTGTLALLRIFLVAVAGTIDPTGTLTKSLARVLAGATTLAGALVTEIQKLLTGTTDGAGALVKAISKTLAGATTPTATLAATLAFLRTVTGTTTPDGALLKQTQTTPSGTTTPAGATTGLVDKALAGTSTPAAAVTQQTQKTLTGATTPSATLAAARALLLTVTGTLDLAGALVRTAIVVLTGTVDGGGTTSQVVQKVLTGSVATAGAVLKTLARLLTGAIGLAGTLTSAIAGTMPALRKPLTVAYDVLQRLTRYDIRARTTVRQTPTRTTRSGDDDT